MSAVLLEGQGFYGYPLGSPVGEPVSARIEIECSGPATATCGDGKVTHDEECDGAELREPDLRVAGHSRTGASFGAKSLCAMFKLGTGTVVCGGNCRLDTRHCAIPKTCGNGKVDDGEVCDGAELGGSSCSTEGLRGDALRCRDDCQLDVSRCQPMLEL